MLLVVCSPSALPFSLYLYPSYLSPLSSLNCFSSFVPVVSLSLLVKHGARVFDVCTINPTDNMLIGWRGQSVDGYSSCSKPRILQVDGYRGEQQLVLL